MAFYPIRQRRKRRYGALWWLVVVHDENLMRSELTATEYAEHMQRRKEIWEAMQEMEVSGEVCPKPRGGRPEQESGASCTTLPTTGRGNTQFAAETSAATGVNKSTVTRATRRARKVCQQARDLIRGWWWPTHCRAEGDGGVESGRFSRWEEEGVTRFLCGTA